MMMNQKKKSGELKQKQEMAETEPIKQAHAQAVVEGQFWQ